MLEIVKNLRSIDTEFEIRKTNIKDLEKYCKILNPEQLELLEATIRNYQITLKADKLLKEKNIDDKKIGLLLSEHHSILCNKLNISTPKIERMVNAAIKAGAYGAKINGSGGGGCMFAYAPENPEKVAKSIEEQGGKAFIVVPDAGVK